jgi:hypothetical protein
VFLQVHFSNKDTENYTLEYPFQHMPLLNDNWAKVSYKSGRSTQQGTEREAKHAKQSEHWPFSANGNHAKPPHNRAC